METFGRYRIERLLGRGGMGEVHQAFDTRNERTVALKRLPSGLSEDDEFRVRFQRESRIAARLSSPHVIPIHDAGEIDGRLYIDMRLVPGPDMAALLATSGPMDVTRATGIVGQVADALHAAHEDGLVHRDVKPSNVLLDERSARDFAYLVDFGIAKSTAPGRDAPLTATGSAIGTMAYMSPEMFSGDVVDRRADVYALACVTFQLLTGRQPFLADGARLMYEHLHSPPPPPSQLRPGLPVALDEVLLRGMAKRPDDRFTTAPDLAAALTRAVTGQPAPDTTTRVLDAGGRTAPVGSTRSYGHGTPPTVFGGAPTAGPAAPWPPPGPGGSPPRERRRMHPALIAVLAVLATLVIVLGSLVAIGFLIESDDAPRNDAATVSAVRSVFPRSGDAGCRNDSSVRAGQTPPLASILCGSDGTRVYYEIWPSTGDATEFFDAYRAGRASADGRNRWSIRGSAEQGPYFSGSLGAEYMIAALYDERRYSIFVIAPTREAADRAFAAAVAVPVEQVPR